MLIKGRSEEIKKTEGKGLLELIIITGILGFVGLILIPTKVMPQFEGYTNQATDASVQVNFSQILLQSAMYLDTNKNYGKVSPFSKSDLCEEKGTFFADRVVDSAIDTVEGLSGNKATCVLGDKGRSFAISLPLISDDSKSFCIDSGGLNGVFSHRESAYVDRNGLAYCRGERSVLKI